MVWRLVGCLAAIISLNVLGRAAEIQLKPNAEAGGPTILLQDLAEIVSQDDGERENLASLELFPAPYKTRYVTAREIQTALASRQVDLGRHTISGASLIEVRPQPANKRDLNNGGSGRIGQRSSQPDARKQAEARIVHTVREFLQSHVDSSQFWQVTVRRLYGRAPSAVDVDTVKIVRVPRRPRRGEVRPWTGQQTFVVRWLSGDQHQEVRVLVDVSLPPAVVVAARDVPRGEILQAEDVRLQPLESGAGQEQGFSRLEDVIGRQTQGPLRRGDTLMQAMLRSPLLVRRGDRVTVHVVRGTVRVRTEGRAKASGAMGDEIVVESSADRKKAFQAVVSGVNEVRVEAPATRLANRTSRR